MALNKLTKVQTLGIGSNIEVVGVITTGQFKSGTSNLHSSGVELTNLNVSGIATIGGNVSIGGTLTYQDVTNIDSVGMITARSGVDASGTSIFRGALQAQDNLEMAGELVHLSDNDTRIRFPANDTISFQTAGSERLRIKSDGKVGINQASPRTTLDVTGYVYLGNGGQIQITGSAGAKGLQLAGADDGANIIGTMGSSGEHLVFRTASNERMRLLVGGSHLLLGGTSSVYEITETSGHAGMVIGSTSLGNAGLAIINSTSGTGRIYFGDATANNAGRNRGMINYYHSGDYMMFATAGSERLRINSSGQTMIGTTTPTSNQAAQALTIAVQNNGNTGITLRSGTSGGNLNEGSIFYSDATSGAGEYAGFLQYSHSGDYFRIGVNSAERLRINSDGDLMVGTTSDVSNVVAIFGKNHNNTTAISVENTDTNSSARIRYEFKNGSNTSYIEKYNSGGWYFFNGTPTSSNPNVGFYASNSWISLRLRPGDTSNDIAEFYQRWGTSNGILMNIGSAQSGTAKAMRFLTSHYGGERGYIGVTLGGTSYNSSSDYRMKQDVVDLTGAIDRVKSFKPRRFKWKEDPTYTVDGFLAHEASSVVPESVDGEKDAVDSNGDPVYQVIDQSKLVPVLTAALKEAIAKIETLETKVAALEGS